MRAVFLSLILICGAGFGPAGAADNETRFTTVEIYLDSSEPVAAWQFELNDRNGAMKVVGHYPTAHQPRSFCIDLTGNYLYSAGQQTAKLIAYRINRKTGALEKLAEYPTGDVPIWVMCANAGR